MGGEEGWRGGVLKGWRAEVEVWRRGEAEG